MCDYQVELIKITFGANPHPSYSIAMPSIATRIAASMRLYLVTQLISVYLLYLH